MNFIHKQLNNEEFYHRTFYYNLSKDEQFLLGMIIQNKLEENLMDYKFNYSEFYLKNSSYINEEKSGSFPYLQINSIAGNSFMHHNLSNQDAELKERIINSTTIKINGLTPEVKLMRIAYSYKYSKEDTEEKIVKPKNFYEVTGDRINLYEMFREKLLDELLKTKLIDIDLTFVFDNKGTQFMVYFWGL